MTTVDDYKYAHAFPGNVTSFSQERTFSERKCSFITFIHTAAYIYMHSITIKNIVERQPEEKRIECTVMPLLRVNV